MTVEAKCARGSLGPPARKKVGNPVAVNAVTLKAARGEHCLKQL